uniref:Uncharacterized protein n=1 Tax=Rhizophora mucronata TaxID=61149 RepID=A0A2P2PFL9_RHIMU
MIYPQINFNNKSYKHMWYQLNVIVIVGPITTFKMTL